MTADSLTFPLPISPTKASKPARSPRIASSRIGRPMSRRISSWIAFSSSSEARPWPSARSSAASAMWASAIRTSVQIRYGSSPAARDSAKPARHDCTAPSMSWSSARSFASDSSKFATPRLRCITSRFVFMKLEESVIG